MSGALNDGVVNRARHPDSARRRQRGVSAKPCTLRDSDPCDDTSACPYLICERTAFRASLDLSAASPVSIIVMA